MVLDTGHAIGVEALLRWDRPGHEPISPAEFIPVAEATGLILPIGEWVLRRACEHLKGWRDAGVPMVPLSVNLSAAQFRDQTLVDKIKCCLDDFTIDPAMLEIEITETALMHDAETATNTLCELVGVGISVSIDDFGPGYSSLNYLKQFPVGKLKIDRSFVADIGISNEDSAIARAVIQLGHSLGLSVLAEGVETNAQLEVLRDLGCDEVQGFLMSRPVTADEYARSMSNIWADMSYHRAECLTHVGDSQAVRSLTQCGELMRFAMAAPIDLRNDFDSVSLRRLAKRTRDATQSRRLLALAEVYDGGSRTDASRIGGVGLQIIRDWVLRFNARGPDGLVDGKSPGAPSKLNADHRRALAEVVEAGPVPAVDGVVRWRRKDLARWLLETFAISLDETTVGRELKALGFAKISARPRHYAQNELAVEAFKKNFPAELAKIRARLPKGVEIELWWQDEARIGQKNKLTRRWARRGTRPRAPRDQRTEWAYIFGAICPAKGKGAGLVMPWCDTDAMAAHLIEISAAVD